jgi:hypothetical protein
MDARDWAAVSTRDSTADARWMTFAELAKVRGISKASAIKLIRRHGWRRQRDNQGHVRALVPLPWTQSDGEQEPDITPDRDRERDNRGDREAYSPPDSVTLDAGLAAAIARAERAENQADEANKRADVAVALADRTLAGLAEANARADRAEQAIATERTRADRAERDLAAERARADRAELAQDRIEVAQAQAEATAEELREAVRKADHDRTTAVAIADEAVRAAEELRQAQAARVGQGRWQRLRAAWRGD